MSRKGGRITNIPIESSVALYFALLNSMYRSGRRDLEFSCWICLGVLETIHGLRPLDDLFNEIVQRKDFQLPILKPHTCKSILVNCIVQSFASSSVSEFKTGRLNISLIERMHYISSCWLSQMETPEYKTAFFAELDDLRLIPIEAAAAAVTRLYTDLIDRVRELVKTGGNWTIDLKSFSLPSTDKSIIDRGN